MFGFVKVMATEGYQAEHPPEKMAMQLIDAIVEVPDSNMAGDRWVAALKLKADLLAILAQPHADVQKETRAAVESNSMVHFTSGNLHDPGDRLDKTMAAAQAAAKPTPWADQFSKPDIAEKMRALIGQSLVDAAHITRLWHAVRHPEDKFAAAYAANPTGTVNLGMSVGE